MGESGYEIYGGDDPKVRSRVLDTIFSTISQITGTDISSFNEESEITADVWVKLREKLAITHLYIVRDPMSFPVKIKEALKNISFAMN